MYPNLKKKKSQKGKKKKKETTVCRRRERKEKNDFFASLKDLRRSDRRFSLEQEVKFIHVSRATHGYQNLGVS